MPSPVKEAALSLRLKLFQPARLDAAFIEEVRALAPDLLVVAAYGKIFRKAFLELFPMGGINLHPSLLPKFRGPSPVSAAILAGDAETGVTVQRIALKFDTGDILAQERYPLNGNETTSDLTEALAVRGAGLLASVLAGFEVGTPPDSDPAEGGGCELLPSAAQGRGPGELGRACRPDREEGQGI